MTRVQTRDSLEDGKAVPCIIGEDEVGSNLEQSMMSMHISNQSAIGTDLEQFCYGSTPCCHLFKRLDLQHPRALLLCL